MVIFTYKEYIKYIHILRLNAVLQLAEESSEYKISKENNNKKVHDKIAKSILENKEEIAKIINKFIVSDKNIEAQTLSIFTNSYITKKYKNKRANIVYKLANEEIFFLIEHQSNADSKMPYRMLNYCIDIMNEWRTNKKGKTTYKYPIIVPIVIYTGDRKWKVPKNFKEKQISTSIFENYKINFKYNLIDINKLSDELLLRNQNVFSYWMLIEKSKTKEELIERINCIIKQSNSEQHLEELKNIIISILDGALKIEEHEDLIEGIKSRRGDGNMSTLVERISDENLKILEKGRQQGISKQKKEIAKKMLEMKFEEEVVLKISGISKNEFEKIKENIS